MKQEIALLIVFLLVFLCDTFMPKRSQGAIGWISIIAFAIITARILSLSAWRSRNRIQRHVWSRLC